MKKIYQILENQEYHYLQDCTPYQDNYKKHSDNSIVLFEYTCNLFEVTKELILNKIQFTHYIDDLKMSYLIIDLEK